LIVIDFIDMANRKHGQQVEDILRKACKGDKARIQFARISRFGLLEMSRQRLHPSVRESTTEGCPRCQGRGSIRTVDSMALQMLTRMEDWAERGKQPTLIVQVPSDTGEYLMNNKRNNIARIEEAYDVQITLQIRPDLDIPHYRIERQWHENNQQRVEVLEDTGKRIKPPRPNRKLKPVKAVVGIPTPVPDVVVETPKKDGPLQSLINLFTGKKKKEPVKSAEKEAVATVMKSYKDAIQNLTSEGTLELFTEEAQVYESGGVEGTYANYLEHHLGPELSHFNSFIFSEYTIDVVIDMPFAFTTETYIYTIDLKANEERGTEGRIIRKKGVATSDLKKIDGKWKITKTHTSSRNIRK